MAQSGLKRYFGIMCHIDFVRDLILFHREMSKRFCVTRLQNTYIVIIFNTVLRVYRFIFVSNE